jgi:hypothetical protein
VKHEKRNVSGQAYSLTVLAPIVEGRESALTRHLDGLPGGDGSPLARVPGTHFARWVVISDVIYEGAGQRRDHLQASRLLFTSNFDGPLAPYLEALRTGLGEDADAIWGHCRGYPGRGDAAAFAGWMRAHQLVSALFFAAYGDQTVGEVHANLALRAHLIEFALGAQDLPPEQLQSGFRARFRL